MITIDDIFIKYWSQVTLLLLTISYFIKRRFDRSDKKTETNHALFQQHKIDAVNKFFKAYAECEHTWKMLVVKHVFEDKISHADLDEFIFSSLNNLQSELINVRIYIDDNIYQLFVDVRDRLDSINNYLQDLYFDSLESNSKKIEKFEKYQLEKLRENSHLLTEIAKKIRDTYK